MALLAFGAFCWPLAGRWLAGAMPSSEKLWPPGGARGARGAPGKGGPWALARPSPMVKINNICEAGEIKIG